MLELILPNAAHGARHAFNHRELDGLRLRYANKHECRRYRQNDGFQTYFH